MAMLKYNETFPAIAEDLAANGESDAYIAFRLQISMATFYNYKAQFPEFAEALVVGRKVCYSRVLAKLLKLAQGRCTVLSEVYKDGELYKTIERQLPPNLKAIIYFQKHMRTGGRLSDLSCWPHGGRLSDELCWPHGQKTENTLPQDDSIMSNGQLSDLSCWPHGQKNENAQPQADSKISNGEEKRTEQTERTNPTGELAARPVSQSGDPMAPESVLPQTDSKMSNERLSGELLQDVQASVLENTLPQTDSKMSNGRLPAEFGLRQ